MGNASGIKVYSKKVLEFVMELLEVAMYFFSCTGNNLLRKFKCLQITVVPNFSPIVIAIVVVGICTAKAASEELE